MLGGVAVAKLHIAVLAPFVLKAAIHAVGTIAHGHVQPLREVVFALDERRNIERKPGGNGVIVFQQHFGRGGAVKAGGAAFKVGRVRGAVRRYFHDYALFAPGKLLPYHERRAEHVGPEIVIAKAPFVAKPIEYFNAALQKGAREATHPHGGTVFYARPTVHAHGPAALVVTIEHVPGLIHAHPFAAIVKAMERAAGVAFVPIVV